MLNREEAMDEDIGYRESRMACSPVHTDLDVDKDRHQAQRDDAHDFRSSLRQELLPHHSLDKTDEFPSVAVLVLTDRFSGSGEHVG